MGVHKKDSGNKSAKIKVQAKALAKAEAKRQAKAQVKKPSQKTSKGTAGVGRIQDQNSRRCFPKASGMDAALAAAYAAAAGPSVDETSSTPSAKPGDAVFEHAFVKRLLQSAREQVQKALDEQVGPEKWLLCVRTYGRARPHDNDLCTYLMKTFRTVGQCTPRGNCEGWAAKLSKIGIADADALKEALKKPKALWQRLEDGGQRIQYKIIERFAEIAKTPIKYKGVEKGLLELTLHALEEALGPSGYKHCLIFVSHEDTDYTEGRYDQALAGTPWADRIVVGVKGAHLQVRFMDEAAPQGTHLIVADDNIDAFCVEIADQNAKDIRPYKDSHNMRYLDHSVFHGAFDGLNLEAYPETQMERFLRGADKRYGMKAMASTLESQTQALHDMGITTPQGLVKELSRPRKPKDLVGSPLKPFSKKIMVGKIKAQMKRGLPVGRWLMKAVNRQKKTASLAKGGAVKKASRQEGRPELEELILRAGREMKDVGANTWSVNTTKNHHFLHGCGEAIREGAKKNGWCVDVSWSLGLIYGAFFGFHALHDPTRYTRFGQIKDDVERSLRYWHRDGIVIRFKRYCVVKANKPGKFHASKGGISAGSSEETHRLRGQAALQAMLKDFAWRYARLPKDGEKCGDCGLIWLAARNDADDKRKSAALTNAAAPAGKKARKTKETDVEASAIEAGA